ncbi:MAG: hypothetical protein HS128_12455 [Ideonella sp.]|nr:hypothetical protein [Ideonella sp.]
MNTIERAFFECALADLVYAGPLVPGDSSSLLTLASRRLTAPLAQEIADRFEVLAVRDDPASDYQGAVFRDKTTGELYVAHRGTEGSVSDPDILYADVDLAFGSGVARSQTAAMVNWWNDISKPANTAYTQIAAGPLDQPFVSPGTATASGGIAAALAAAGGRVRVVGHSLGGHLTTVFGSVFSNQVSHSSTFNGAGLFSIGASIGALGQPLTLLAQLLGSTVALPGASQDNFYAMNGLSVTTNGVTFTQYGTRIGIYNEEDVTPAIGNHYLYKLTDALAAFRAIERLDPTVDVARLNAIAQGSSPDDLFVVAERTLENLLDGLRRVIQNPAAVSTPPGDDGGNWETGAMPMSRTAYHANLKSFMESNPFRDIAGKVRLDPSSADLGAKARNDFSALASLITLSPVVLTATTGNRSVLDGALRSVWGQTYLDWDADRSRLPAERDAGKDVFTAKWIADRAILVESIVAQNKANGSGTAYSIMLPTDRSFELRWIDAQGTQQVVIAENTARKGGVHGQVPSQLLNFGGNGDDMVVGSANQLEDHLYGMAGNDTLTGLSGGDWLEGNQGNDTLDGGPGADLLLGGMGDDTYVFGSTWGDDVIIDSDGQGSLRVPGYDAGLPQGKRQPNGKYETPTQDVTYTVQQITPTRKDLYIEFANRADTITIRNWSPGALGITLDDSIAPLVPNYVDTGDAQPNRLTAFHDPDGAGPLEGEYVRDVSLAGGQGDDTVLGYIGNDILQGGAGSDIVLGEASVIVVTSPPAGEPGDDRIFGDGEVEIDSAIAQGNVQTPSGVKGDWLGGWDDEDGHSSSRVSWRGSRRPNDEFKRLESVIGCHRRDSVGARRSPQAGLAAIAWSDACAG